MSILEALAHALVYPNDSECVCKNTHCNSVVGIEI